MTGGLKIFAAFAFLSGGPLLGFASAQNQTNYGLSDLKPYNGALASKPATNDLQRIINAHAAPPNAANKPVGDPAFTIHAVGGVMIESTIRR